MTPKLQMHVAKFILRKTHLVAALLHLRYAVQDGDTKAIVVDSRTQVSDFFTPV